MSNLSEIFVYINIFALPIGTVAYGFVYSRIRDYKRKWLTACEMTLIKQEKANAAIRERDEARSGRDTYKEEFRKAKKIIEDLKAHGSGFHDGDLSPSEESELLTRMDEILAQNDALLDEIEILKGA